MKRVIAAFLVAASLASADSAAAGGHLVRSADIDKALVEAGEKAAADRQRLQEAVSRPEAEATAQRLGVDARRLRTAVASLSDEEVRDLTARAERLQSDPAATGSNSELLTLLLIILLVIVILKAV